MMIVLPWVKAAVRLIVRLAPFFDDDKEMNRIGGLNLYARCVQAIELLNSPITSIKTLA